MGIADDAVLAAAGFAVNGQGDIGRPQPIQHVQLTIHNGVAGENPPANVILQSLPQNQRAVGNVAILFDSHSYHQNILFSWVAMARWCIRLNMSSSRFMPRQRERMWIRAVPAAVESV